MEKQEILRHVDHTLLDPTATWGEIREICDEAIRYGVATVCIPPCYVKAASEYMGEGMKVCTVVGFPNGNVTTGVKVFETEGAIRDGADEIDMVINLGWVKEGRWGELLEEIKAVKEACGGRVLKVIVEACKLTEGEKVKMCEIVSESGAEYIKTSTGFSTGGATREDVELFKEHVRGGVKIKAAGGIRTLGEAEEFMKLGAERLGTSRIVRLIKEEG